MKNWFKSGAPWIWLSGATVSISLIMVIGLVMLIAARGLGVYWPGDVFQFELNDKANAPNFPIVGEIYEEEKVSIEKIKSLGINIDLQNSNKNETLITRLLIKTGNRDIYGGDFKWIIGNNVKSKELPKDIVVFERHEWGNLYAHITEIKENNNNISSNADIWNEFQRRLSRTSTIHHDIKKIEKHDIGKINYQLETLRLDEKRLKLNNKYTTATAAEIESDKALLQRQYEGLQKTLQDLYQQIRRDSVIVSIAGGQKVEVPLSKIVRAYKPNAMGTFEKVVFYFESLWLFVSEDPREANTEGGIFPAIFGTVMMVIIMSIIVTPFGIVAAIYLREYAKQGALTRTIRIAVNNLAGVPSIVYGVFGLGFFVYFLGGNIDQLFFPEALPAPTFGTSGILWASLTLAILTVPVVIVATEEGLSRIPKTIREGSLALGATKWETLWKTVLPMASPAMMTGLILAVARAAGEVAPLMLVGVVKLAPSLPLDENFPFLHLDRKFMHLGFHIYDVGFQSPNVEAARPLVYATALLLIVIIIALNITAITLRNRLREKYKSLDH